MLSYRHGFHAGNHADVLKHFVQVQLHQYMNQKDAAYTYIDTHSGAGVYALDSGYASKNAEFETGIAPLWTRDDLPPALAEYVNLVRAMNPSGKLRYYPGSPYVAEQCAREEDRLRLFELHPADSKILAENFRKLADHQAEQGVRPRGRRVLIERGDGFHSLKALLPPPSRRALVLIDPPYEVKDDYRKVRDALDEALGRFPSGMYAVWYPVLHRIESRNFADKLKRLPAKEWLHVTLTISTPSPDGFGLHSSGMFILNPPYTLEATLREVMPYLVQALGKDGGARFTIEKGTQLSGAIAHHVDATAGARAPVGNARRASPLSGAGSLRLPGQRMPTADEEAPAGRARSGAERKWFGPARTADATGGQPRGDAPAGRGPRGEGGTGRTPRAAESGNARGAGGPRSARDVQGRPARSGTERGAAEAGPSARAAVGPRSAGPRSAARATTGRGAGAGTGSGPRTGGPKRRG